MFANEKSDCLLIKLAKVGELAFVLDLVLQLDGTVQVLHGVDLVELQKFKQLDAVISIKEKLLMFSIRNSPFM